MAPPSPPPIDRIARLESSAPADAAKIASLETKVASLETDVRT